MQTPNNLTNINDCPNAPVKIEEEVDFNLSPYEGRNLMGAFEELEECSLSIDSSLGG